MCVLGSRPMKLYDICLVEVGKILKLIAHRYSETEAEQYSKDLFSKLGTRIIEDLMTKTYYDQETWHDIQNLFLYGRISRLICKWDEDLFTQLNAITPPKEILVFQSPSNITADDIIVHMGKYTSVDFDGELFWRGESYDDYVTDVFKGENISWLSTSQDMIRYLISCRQKIPKYVYQDTYRGILELHLGNLTTTTADIIAILRAFPNLLVLRSYKLVKALYEMHREHWKTSGVQQRYQLRNLDADFSYVGRCTLAVQPMLPLDALQLATELCPEAYSIRVRFDCSTHHDIMMPLKNLRKIKDLSVVCVTNGERSLMDFTDIEPVLRHHGNYIKSLELKVIDEVDTHVITRFCPKLEVLILSGSNYVTPHTCVSYQCSQTNPTTTTTYNNNSSNNNNASNANNLTKLRIFFFAEGDNTICNNVPQCFWYSTLKPSDPDKKVELQAAFAIHKKRAKAFFDFIHPPPGQDYGSEILDDTVILSFDCEKNLQLLRIPDTSAYYKRNVYLYNFAIVQGYSTGNLSPANVTSYVWTENEFKKDSNAIASCILDKLNELDLQFYKHIRLVSDGCCGQNKNSTLVAAILKWFEDSAPNHLISIEQVFPVTGHSYIPPDRVFAQIEKETRKMTTIINPDNYIEIIKKYSTVKRVGTDVKLYDIRKAASAVLKPCSNWNFQISKCKRVIFKRNERNRKVIHLKGELFYYHDTGIFSSSYCKRGQRISNLVYEEIDDGNVISAEKRKDLLDLLVTHFGEDWRGLPSLQFFVYLLDVVVDEVVVEGSEHQRRTKEDVDDPNQCVCVEEAPELIV